MSERKLYWRRAADWGAILGMILISLEGIALAFKSSTLSSVIFALLVEIAILAVLWFSGRQNVYTVWSKPYNYGRSLGFVALVLLFAGIVRGAGLFVTNEWLTDGYYTNILKEQLDFTLNSGEMPEPVRAYLEQSKEEVLRYMHNPLVCMLSGVFSMFDLVLLFVPPIFLRQKQENNTINNE
jgi:hypothetical protein